MPESIEREALLERIDDIWDCADLVFEPNDHCCRAADCAYCKWAETKNAIRKIIANFPAADVRPVVFCRDCKHNMANIPDIKYGININENWNACQLTELYDSVKPDDFCSRGEKRETEDEKA